MAKPLEEHLADYLLGLQRTPDTKKYNRDCLSMWRENYVEQIARQTEKIVKERWKK